MKTADFDFDLPERLIAQAAAPRGTSKLLVLRRGDARLEHTSIASLPDLLRAGDLLVLNDTKVFPARLLGTRVPSGGAVECLLLAKLDDDRWDALVHPGQKLKSGSIAEFRGETHALHAEILERRFHGRRTIRLWSGTGATVEEAIDALGHVPLPPYIARADEASDRERYQTVYARARGSVAAPTAGLHFSDEILEALARRGVERTAVTLHVGYGTFQPVRVDDVEGHALDAERFEIGEATAIAVNTAKKEGRRVIAVGTTTTRTLEAAARLGGGVIAPSSGSTDLFIYPGFTFQIVGGLLTNFHLPKSSLLMLVSAFAGRERVLEAYREAVEREYRFYSYGDAMLIL